MYCLRWAGKERYIMENEKKIYLLEIWILSTNEWGDRTKNHRVLMNLVTLADEAYDYKYHTLARIVKEVSGDNVDNQDYEVSTWIDDDNNSMFLMSDWGNTRDKGNQWYGVEAVLTLTKEVNEI